MSRRKNDEDLQQNNETRELWLDAATTNENIESETGNENEDEDSEGEDREE